MEIADYSIIGLSLSTNTCPIEHNQEAKLKAVKEIKDSHIRQTIFFKLGFINRPLSLFQSYQKCAENNLRLRISNRRTQLITNSPTFVQMQIRSAEFKCSNTRTEKLPPAVLPEYAFIGRSNVGKSSLINMLTQRKGLAKTSQTPGKTQLINHFLINENWYLVDLPGYGYAKSSKANRGEWERFIRYYLKNRENLQCVFVLIDSRLDPQKVDLEFCAWLGEHGIPFILIFTKADKQSRLKTEQSVSKFRKAMLQYFEEVPQHFVTSSESKEGRDEVLEFIHQINGGFKAPILE